jgi:hypothetical protein
METVNYRATTFPVINLYKVYVHGSTTRMARHLQIRCPPNWARSEYTDGAYMNYRLNECCRPRTGLSESRSVNPDSTFPIPNLLQLCGLPVLFQRSKKSAGRHAMFIEINEPIGTYDIHGYSYGFFLNLGILYHSFTAPIRCLVCGVGECRDGLVV